MILLTRKADFSAAHFYWNDAWTEDQNVAAFGKCANRNGHGHNYTLEVTVAGEVDAVTGFVVDLKQLKEVPEFRSVIPTTENIAIAIWKRLEGKIPGARLYKVRVYEMPDLFAEYRGEA